MVMAFKPEGIVVSGILFRKDTTLGNLNFYKSVEGFLESFPQAIYQISILLRSVQKIGMKMLHFNYVFLWIKYLRYMSNKHVAHKTFY